MWCLCNIYLIPFYGIWYQIITFGNLAPSDIIIGVNIFISHEMSTFMCVTICQHMPTYANIYGNICHYILNPPPPPPNIGPGEHRTRGTWDPGNIGPGEHRTRGTWDPGNIGPGEHRTRGTWDPGNIGPGEHRTRGT